MRIMSDNEVIRFKKSCYKWENYKDIAQYKDDVVACLMYSSWHYSEENARDIVDNIRKQYIEEAYRDKEPAYDAACEAGYFAG